ncbi:MAG TPA: DUF3108 domain-containing protein [Myxococcaceae bacterium]|nr:DUF3108 domain-containing protein [Myxococcaceae bacterium]
MTLRTALLLLIVGSGLASASAPQAPLPSDEACRPLPPLLDLPPFPEGERLKFELDAMGAKAGQMTMQVLPLEDGLMPIRVEAEASTFLRSLRNVKGQATTWVDPRRLTPRRYAETSQDNDVQRRYRVTFSKDAAAVGWSFNGRRGQSVLALPKTTYDVAGITYLARRLPLKEGQSLCLDLYGVRRIWRLWGTVTREEVNHPLGTFTAYRFSGEAARRDRPAVRREVHLWISDDARRLPLAAVGTVNSAAMRATLVGYEGPGEKARRLDDPRSLKW